MTREDYNYAKSIYDKMFWMQVFKPEEMKKAYRGLFGAEPANTQQARARVAAYFRYDVKPTFDDEIDKTETALPKQSETISVDNTNQSHRENSPNGVNQEVEEMLQLDELTKPKRKRTKK